MTTNPETTPDTQDETPDVTVTIAQWGKTDWTDRCVRSLRRGRDGDRLEILVYDNASPDGPGPVADRDDVDVVRGEENIGFGPAHNVLAGRARGRYLLVCNNDVIVDPACIATMVAIADAHDGPCIVSPRYRNFDGRTLECGGYLAEDAGGWQHGHGQHLPPSLSRQPFQAHYASAACLLVPRREFLDTGGFDDVFAPAYYEDADLCLRFASLGHPVIVAPAALAYHHEGTTSGTDTSTGFKAYQVRNKSLFQERWASSLAGRPALNRGSVLQHVLQHRVGSGRRPLVLWVLPQLPRPDAAAGELRVVAMIEQLLAHGADVVVHPVTVYDAERYGPVLERLDVRWFGNNLATRTSAPRPVDGPALAGLLDTLELDTVIVSWPTTAEPVLSVVRAHAPDVPVIVDAVDLHFVREERSSDFGGRATTFTKSRELAVYRAADAVLVASDFEQGQLRVELPGVDVAVYTAPFGGPVETDGDLGRRCELTFLGNFHHHPNTDAVRYWVDELGPAVAERIGRTVPLVVYGAAAHDHLGDLAAQAPELVEVRGWIDDLADAFDTARIAVIPLRYGAGTKGKIAAAACHGVPVVTTSIGAEGLSSHLRDALWVEDDTAGLADAVVALLDDETWYGARAATEEGSRLDAEAQATQGVNLARWVGQVRRRTPEAVPVASIQQRVSRRMRQVRR